MEKQQDNTQAQPVDDNYESNLKGIFEDNVEYKQQDKTLQSADDNFESKLKGIIEESDENNDKEQQQDKSNIQQYEPSFKLISRRRKHKIKNYFFLPYNDQ
jgi:hypothetical protein